MRLKRDGFCCNFGFAFVQLTSKQQIQFSISCDRFSLLSPKLSVHLLLLWPLCHMLEPVVAHQSENLPNLVYTMEELFSQRVSGKSKWEMYFQFGALCCFWREREFGHIEMTWFILLLFAQYYGTIHNTSEQSSKGFQSVQLHFFFFKNFDV